MKTIVYHTDDKSKWGPGPWQDEPDKVQWLDEPTKLPCLIVRNTVGAWCGYVGVGAAHPHFEKHYDEVDVSVHGGLTFARHCSHGAEDKSICHLIEPGEDDNVWWFGFDCAHAGDDIPGLKLDHQEVYRTQQYVMDEVRSLAKQLEEIAAEEQKAHSQFGVGA